MKKTITGRFKINNYWLKAGSISLMNRLSMMVLNYTNFILLARILSKNDFGTWIIFFSILKVTESVRTAFIYNPLLKFINSEDEEYHKDIVGSSLLLNFSISFFISVIVLIIGLIIELSSKESSLSEMLNISLIAVFIYCLFSHFNFIQQAKLKFIGTLVSSTVQLSIPSLSLLYIYFNEIPILLTQVTWLYVLGYASSAIVSILFVKRKKEAVRAIFDKEWYIKQFNFGKFTFGTNLSSMLNKSSKEWLLGGLISNASVALFAPALRVVNLFEVPLNAMAQVYYPKTIKKIKEEGSSAAKKMYEKSVGIMFFMLLPFAILVFLFAKEIIHFLVGPEFHDSIFVLKIIVFGSLLAPFVRQFGVTLNAIGMQKMNFTFVVSNSIAGILISVICIILLGLKGAAIATFLIYVASTTACLIILKVHFNVRIISIFRSGYLELINQLKSIRHKR